MSRKNKKKKGLAVHSDYCKCKDCNETFYKEDMKEISMEQEVKKEIKKATAMVPSVDFKHAASCLCKECVLEKNKQTPTLDHTLYCVCYKCKKDKELGKTGVVNNKSTYTASTTYTSCHDGNVFIFKKDGISIYGAGNLKDSEPHKVDIVLDLDRNVKTASWKEDLPSHFKSREMSNSKVVVLDLFIKDMHAPEHATAEFWRLFWEDLKGEAQKKDNKNLKVLVMCQGGHGRTGVVVASLIMASAYNKTDIPKNQHVVAWIREKYCDKAVESIKQTDYLSRVWGMRFVSASKSSFTKGNNTNGTSNKETVDPKEIPNADTTCYVCNRKRTSTNRILFSADVKEFECDTCFGIRADKDEETDEPSKDDEATDVYDQTDKCDGLDCYDEYDDQLDVWSTHHTFTNGCDLLDDTNCGGKLCGYHSNTISKGIIHTYDDGCEAERGDYAKRIADMTEKEYTLWAKTLL